MIQIVTFCIFFNILVFVLPKMWKNAILDMSRDQLFDTRKELRTYFLENGYGLEHPIYRELREILNYHLKMTEKWTFLSTVILIQFVAKNREIIDSVGRELNKQLATDDNELRDFIAKIRKQGEQSLINYLVFSSMWFVLLILLPISIYGIIFAIFRRVSVTYLDIVKKPLSALLTKFFPTSNGCIEEFSYCHSPRFISHP